MTSLARHGLRIAVSVMAGAVAAVLARFVAPPEITTAIGWDAAALAYSGQVWAALLPASADEVRALSGAEDEGRWAITLIATAAVAASFLAIFDIASHASDGWVMALTAATILCSWVLLHTVFAVHYAHRCFVGGEENAGLDFPGEAPRFVDFAYYAFTIGMTFQTSDVATRTSDMRRLTLAHGVASFVFNTVIIAISVGLASGLLGG